MAKRSTPPPPHDPADNGAERGRMPPLTMVRAFEAVGRTASMRRAAVDLGVCHTVVSRHVRNLEGWLGARLVESGPRGVVLTDEGRAFHRAAAAAFDLIAEATRELKPARTRGLLRVWCVPGLAARWLAPRLADLQAALPEVEIVLKATTERPDFAHHEADAEIRYAAGPDAAGRSVLLERSRLFPVASPAWVSTHEPIVRLADLEHQRLIHEESRDQWRRWFEATGHRPRGDLAGPRLWYASSALDAAVAGQGVALATRLQAADDIVAGRLVELLETEVDLGGYWFVAPEARWNDPLLARFRTWLARSVAETRGGETNRPAAPV
ncbi:LysR substrate-binding domain-containing protein [Pinisolibacter sp.]|uniref:LysR substrate-binding domain-containing protein n=1 Tax=Pinisolibacter sp. TaxID=2172024 RepID=UPI002FDCC990